MSTGVNRVVRSAVVLGLLLLSPAAGFAKGRKISLGDDPSLKEGSPAIVLVELSDFQ